MGIRDRKKTPNYRNYRGVKRDELWIEEVKKALKYEEKNRENNNRKYYTSI